jgi:hypothetical protein
MKPHYTLLAIPVFLTLFSCSKDKASTEDEYKNVCFKGKYVGTGCWDVVQIISPIDQENVENSTWSLTKPDNSKITFDHVIGTGGLPQEYKTGDTFYFNIVKIDREPVHTQECSPTKYVAVLANLSNTACDSSTGK